MNLTPLPLDSFVRRSPLLLPAIAAGCGVVSGDQGVWFLPITISLFVAGFAFWVRKQSQPSWGIWLLTAVFFLIFAGLQERVIRHIENFPLKESLASGDSIELSGSGWVRDIRPTSSRSARAVIEVKKLTVAGHTLSIDQSLPVRIQAAPDELKYGSEFDFTGLLRPLEGASAPGGFNPANFYYRQFNSPAQLEIRSGDTCEISGDFMGSHLVAAAKGLRQNLETRLLRELSPEEKPFARLIAAMTLGARENSPEELEDWYRRSGTMHLFAVSGLHVGIIAGTMLFFVLLLRLPKRWAVLVIIPLLLFYAILTGLRPSAIRAAIMLSIVLASFAAKEQPRLLNSLSLAALLLLAINPQQLFLPGFQLSFAVLLAIITLSDMTRKFLAQPWLSDPLIPRGLLSPAQRFKDRFVETTTAALAVSLVAWLGSVLPLSWHFQSVAPVGIVANVVMVPIASLLVVLAVVTFGCFGLHLPWIGDWLSQLCIGLASILTALAQFFATLPGAHLHIGSSKPDTESEILTLDITGQRGDMACLLTDQQFKSHWMIDCGSMETYRYQMLPVLRHRGVNRLEGLLLSHGDQGHLGAAPLVLNQLGPPLLFEADSPNRAAIYPEIVAVSESLGAKRFALSSGNRLSLSPEIKCQIIAPNPSSPNRFADDRCLVLRLTVRGWNILFSFDAGFETEKQLLESGALIESDIWIRGQHCESPSGLEAFVSAVNPKIVISTHSKFPPSERISEGLKDQIQSIGGQLITLDRAGVVTLRISPEFLEISSFRSPDTAYMLKKQ